MTQPRRLDELAAEVGGEVRGDGARLLHGIATLGSATADELSFLTNARYTEAAARSRAGAFLVGRGGEIEGRDLVICAEPYHALAQLLAVFHPETRPAAGVDPRASVEASATVDQSATVEAFAVVGARARIGARSVISPHSVVGEDCRIGVDTVLHPHVVLYRGTILGDRCVVHSGVIVGSDGFGYASHRGGHRKVPQVGIVVIEDDVEIGANSAIDRAMLEETRIGAGTKIDDLVMVAHNVRVGRACLLIAQSGVAGSTQLGDGVVLAGQVGVAGHLRLGSGARVAAKSAVFKDVPEGQQVAGIPAIEAGSWRRQQAVMSRLDDLRRRLRQLERMAGAGSVSVAQTEEGT